MKLKAVIVSVVLSLILFSALTVNASVFDDDSTYVKKEISGLSLYTIDNGAGSDLYFNNDDDFSLGDLVSITIGKTIDTVAGSLFVQNVSENDEPDAKPMMILMYEYEGETLNNIFSARVLIGETEHKYPTAPINFGEKSQILMTFVPNEYASDIQAIANNNGAFKMVLGDDDTVVFNCRFSVPENVGKIASDYLAVIGGEPSAQAPDTEQNVSEDLTKQVQDALNLAGFDCGVADGIAGEKTRTAIRNFRVDHGLSDGDEIDDDLLNALGLKTSGVNDIIGPETNYNLAFKKTGPEYSIYYLFDMDHKKVLYFTDNDTGVLDGDVSGDSIHYNGGDLFEEYKINDNVLTVIASDGFTSDYGATDANQVVELLSNGNYKIIASY